MSLFTGMSGKYFKLFLTQPGSVVIIILTQPEVHVPNSTIASNVILTLTTRWSSGEKLILEWPYCCSWHHQESPFARLAMDYWTHPKCCKIPFPAFFSLGEKLIMLIQPIAIFAQVAFLACWVNFTEVSRGQRSHAYLISFDNELQP